MAQDRSQTIVYKTNALGDVFARVAAGREEPVNPDDWGWAHGTLPERRESVDGIRGLPGFTVTVTDRPDLRFEPGPKPKRPKSARKWGRGAAPPAMAFSKAGADNGTASRWDRLSDALGYAAWSLPRNPQSNPFHVWDLVAGRLVEISYAPLPARPGTGTVYVVEDGIGVKVGHTDGPPPKRIAELQVGNPRTIVPVAMVLNASEEIEAWLQSAFSRWALRGEWFERGAMTMKAREFGGWENLLRHHLPAGDWDIRIYR